MPRCYISRVEICHTVPSIENAGEVGPHVGIALRWRAPPKLPTYLLQKLEAIASGVRLERTRFIYHHCDAVVWLVSTNVIETLMATAQQVGYAEDEIAALSLGLRQTEHRHLLMNSLT